jgi:uncharacterized lipoprotein YajG
MIVKTCLVGCVTAALLIGCAVPSQRLDISYAPKPHVALIPGSHAWVIAVEVKDSRLEKSQQNTRNGYLASRQLQFNSDIAAALRWALESEFKNLGFQIGSPAHITVAAELVRFNHDDARSWITWRAVSDIHYFVRIYDRHQQFRYATTVTTHTTDEAMIYARAGLVQQVANATLASSIQQLFSDKAFIASLLKRE